MIFYCSNWIWGLLKHAAHRENTPVSPSSAFWIKSTREGRPDLSWSTQVTSDSWVLMIWAFAQKLIQNQPSGIV